MTEKLDNFFNLESQTEQTKKELDETKEIVVVEDIDQVNFTSDPDAYIVELAKVSQHSKDMDKLAARSMEGYEQIFEYAENSDTGQARLFEIAAQMMKNAIDAKNSKVDARLKAADLMLKKKKYDDSADLDMADVVDSTTGNITGNRNEILAALKQIDSKQYK